MRFADWLDVETGRAARVAERFSVTLSAVSQWRTNGVPVNKMLEVHEFTGREVSLAEMLNGRGGSAARGKRTGELGSLSENVAESGDGRSA